MGMGTWLRRWVSLVISRGETYPCTLCRCDIPVSDFEKGMAVILARRKFCSGCVEEITRRADKRPGWTLAADLGSSSTVLLR